MVATEEGALMPQSPSWIVLIAAVLVLLAIASLPQSRRRRLALVARTARRVGLPPHADAVDLIVRRRRRALRWSTAGAAAGLGLAAITIPVAVTAPIATAGFVLGALCGWLLSGLIVTRLIVARMAVGIPSARVARARRTGLDDYVSVPERWAARAGGLVCAVLGATAVSAGPAEAAALPAAALGAAALVVFEVGGRQVAATPQPAASADLLAWQDALRSLDLRDAAWAPVVIAVYGAAAAWIPASGVPASIATAVIGATVPAYGVLLVLGTLWRQHLDRHVLRRLWPDRAARLEAADRTAPAAQPAEELR